MCSTAPRNVHGMHIQPCNLVFQIGHYFKVPAEHGPVKQTFFCCDVVRGGQWWECERDGVRRDARVDLRREEGCTCGCTA
jgi:hypothetical protein